MTNKIATAQLDGDYRINDGLSLKVGVNFKKYDFDSWALARVNEGSCRSCPPASPCRA
ncbi:hypothetical protein ACRAWD_06330 [Caulobacter segnis]